MLQGIAFLVLGLGPPVLKCGQKSTSVPGDPLFCTAFLINPVLFGWENCFWKLVGCLLLPFYGNARYYLRLFCKALPPLFPTQIARIARLSQIGCNIRTLAAIFAQHVQFNFCSKIKKIYSFKGRLACILAQGWFSWKLGPKVFCGCSNNKGQTD